MRKHWSPLFDKYGLDAAFENDHHIYKRSNLIKGGKVDPSGTLYIGDGAWGYKPVPFRKRTGGMWLRHHPPAM